MLAVRRTRRTSSNASARFCGRSVLPRNRESLERCQRRGKVVLEKLSEEASLLREARGLGLNPEDFRCTCEVCLRTSELCNASASVLSLAVTSERQNKSVGHGKDE